MSPRRIVFEIARWEFRRWFKWKDQVVTLLIALVLSVAVFGGMALLRATSDDPVRISIIGGEILDLTPDPGSRMEFQAADPGDEARLRGLVGSGEIDALLLVRSLEEAELLVYKAPPWQAELERRLSGARTMARIRALGIPPAQLADALRPLALSVTIHEAGRRPSTTAEKVAAGLVIGLMLLGIFTGMGYQFVSITGEKQIRVTEMIISAVSPQQWMDGKILGLSILSAASLITNAVSVFLFVLVSAAFGSGWTVPVEVAHPSTLLLLLLIGLGGFLLWNTVFAAVAATVNDPNTSARSALILLPAFPLAFAFFALNNPDSIAMRMLSVIPITSPAVLSARLVLTEVAMWEVPLALLLLVGTAWFFRTASGRIFRLGMLMYGKEPTLKETLRWAREA